MSLRITRAHSNPKPVDEKLVGKLEKATEDSISADIGLEVLRETLEKYKVLTAILTNANL